MSTEPAQEYRDIAPKPLQLPALFRFLLAAILVFIVNATLPRLSFDIFGDHVVVADTVYRWTASILLVAGFLFFTRVLDQLEGDAWTYIGLPRTSTSIRQSLIGVAWGAALISLAVIPVALTGEDVMFRFNTRTVLRLAVTTALLVGGALLEELMFRGYPFQRLIEAIGAPGAILVLSIFFGAVHLNNPNAGGIWSWGFFNTLAVGVLFALAYLRTGSLWFPIGIHFGWNFFLGVIYGLPVSGIKDFSVAIRSITHGPKLVTGGPYGIEASVTGSVVILVGILGVSFFPKRFLGVPSEKPLPSI